VKESMAGTMRIAILPFVVFVDDAGDGWGGAVAVAVEAAGRGADSALPRAVFSAMVDTRTSKFIDEWPCRCRKLGDVGVAAAASEGNSASFPS